MAYQSWYVGTWAATVHEFWSIPFPESNPGFLNCFFSFFSFFVFAVSPLLLFNFSTRSVGDGTSMILGTGMRPHGWNAKTWTAQPRIWVIIKFYKILTSDLTLKIQEFKLKHASAVQINAKIISFAFLIRQVETCETLTAWRLQIHLAWTNRIGILDSVAERRGLQVVLNICSWMRRKVCFRVNHFWCSNVSTYKLQLASWKKNATCPCPESGLRQCLAQVVPRLKETHSWQST